MRYLVLVQKCNSNCDDNEIINDNNNNDNINNNNVNINDTNDNNINNNTYYHIYDMDVYNKHRALTVMYDSNEFIRKNFKKIFKYLHPFETIASTIRSSFIPNCPPLKITNAFMKMYEFLEHIDKLLPTEGTLRMFDIAGAPGMFVLATEYYLNHSINKKNVVLDWHACSLKDDDALGDYYRLYEFNPNRFQPCNVLNEDDIKKCMTKGKFDLVTGDIGIMHDNDFSKLQEENQLDIQWGQMALALNLANTGGNMFLKMYTYVTEESHYLIDVLTKYFEFVYLSKPFTSRLINDESYIICINRNNINCNNVSLKRPLIKKYVSCNKSIITTFESTRADYRIQMVSLISRILENMPNITFKAILQNYTYKIYYNQLERLNYLFYYINKNKNINNNNNNKKHNINIIRIAT